MPGLQASSGILRDPCGEFLKSAPKNTFFPEEVLFAVTSRCNLSCPHCNDLKSRERLPESAAVNFLRECKKIGIKKAGFTGGEPFLEPDFLYEVISSSVRYGFKFDRIMTNGVWYKDKSHLLSVLSGLSASGYDGDICVSVDAFHRQSLKKLSTFINAAVSLWRRPDIISIASVRGAKDIETRKKLKTLAAILKSRPIGLESSRPRISRRGIFIKILYIDLSAVGKASLLKNPWEGKWFTEDYCKGPGNVFFVMPSGDVKPCCGYASHLDRFTIGNILNDKPMKILKNLRQNIFLSAVFGSGLQGIRKKLEKKGTVFPGMTSDHCFFCYYVATRNFSLPSLLK